MLDVDKFLKQNGMNKSQLAKKAGLKQANLYAGLRNPTLQTLQKIANALNVTPAELLAAQETDKVKKRVNKYSRVKLNAIIICNGEHYEPSNLQELLTVSKTLKNRHAEVDAKTEEN
ncbi:MAG: helix-turn-helix transcriptional regulator [Bacteroidaceae bacterium]|nr:helix-turn-helix transcriptional regulator [Bacteroidaceae bacterium]